MNAVVRDATPGRAPEPPAGAPPDATTPSPLAPSVARARGEHPAANSEPAGVDPYDAIVLAGGRASRLDGAAKPGLLSDGVPLLHLALDAAGDARRIAVVGPDDLAAAIAPHPAAPRTLLTREDPPFGGPVAGIAAGLAALRRGDSDLSPGTDAPVVGGSAHGRSSTGTTTRRTPDHTAPDHPAWVLVLAVDVPRVGAAVPQLVAVVQGQPAVDGAFLVADGRAQWLVGIYRVAALTDRVAATGVKDALTRRGEAPPASPDPLHGNTPTGRGASVRHLLSGLRLLEIPDPGSLSADVDTWDDAERLGVRPGPVPKERP